MKLFGFTEVHHLICPALAHYKREFSEFSEPLKTNPKFKELQALKK